MASGLEWREEYRLGIGKIDQQHIHLFEIVAQITDLDAITSTKEELKAILVELSRYMKEHFSEEEVYMHQIDFPEYEYHRNLHREIIEFVNTSVTNSPTLAMIRTKLKFIIKKALIDHIVTEDMKYKLYAASLKENRFDECLVELA
ncbi:bacteriohemerythrin [Sulfuricurvum sp.]|uniref:bacteriohemerythrin n=1 Tax=Sulfuricurvum sp. TaxID=2025608 RepID=UPI0026072D49|nr:bacteriohemerythrin [Sulfuricurvum sp.]MDD2781404.1 bacteriohemerythrin [Sulfuricurvum sp.]